MWCTDNLTPEDRAAWYNKTVDVKGNIEYWHDQVTEYNYRMEDLEKIKHTMSNDDYLKNKAEIEENIKDNVRNLNSYRRRLAILERDGPQPGPSTIPSSSSSTKREASGLAEDLEKGSSKKR